MTRLDKFATVFAPLAAVIAVIAVIAAAPFLSACATMGGTPSNAPALEADIRVQGLRADEREVLDEELCRLPGVLECRATRKGDPAEWKLRYQGTLASLNTKLSKIQQPGLEPLEQEVKLTFQGFDNVPPKIEILTPTGGTVTETKIEVVVEVPDRDVDDVRINGQKARKSQGTLYKRDVTLVEGPNKIEVQAADRDGNTSNASVDVVVDTTPPDVNATIKVVIEGQAEPGSIVIVDGKQVSTGLTGGWRVELAVRKGKRTVEIVAIDKHGNKTVEERKLFE